MADKEKYALLTSAEAVALVQLKLRQLSADFDSAWPSEKAVRATTADILLLCQRAYEADRGRNSRLADVNSQWASPN